MRKEITGVRTAQDLERKYPLSDLLSIKKAVEKSETELININKDLENFVSSTVESIDNLQSQIDGQIHTYYYSGVPTLENLPASEWLPEEYNNYLGDLYYDKDTGYAYRFFLDNETNIFTLFSPSTILPITYGVSPAALIASIVLSTSAGSTQTIIPIPML